MGAIYYATDIHLEFQLDILRFNLAEEDITCAIGMKIDEMIPNDVKQDDILIIGGDVSHSPHLVNLFYAELVKKWNGLVVAILGNHELWNGNLNALISPPVEDIIMDYRVSLAGAGCVLLENMLMTQKDGCSRCYSSNKIWNMPDGELYDMCSKADRVILGGLGFSGCNMTFNAENGIYRAAVTTLKEDKELSKRFERTYARLLDSCHDLPIVIATHNPPIDWTTLPLNKDWTYICGHTHTNRVKALGGRGVLYMDNQIGYDKKVWGLKQC